MNLLKKKESSIRDGWYNRAKRSLAKGIVAASVGLAALTGIAVTHGDTASAADKKLSDHSKGQYIGSGSSATLPNKYSFIGKFTPKTKAVSFGSGWDVRQGSSATAFAQADPPDSRKGDIGVIYRNVGTYEGQTIDLRITVTGWSKFSTTKEARVFSYGQGSISHRMSGYHYVTQRWEYMIGGTATNATNGQRASMMGSYYTFTDLDGAQQIAFNSTTTSQIQRMYLYDRNWVRYRDTAYGLEIGTWEKAGINSTAGDVTVAFDTTSITFRWQRDWAAAGVKPDYFSGSVIGDQYMGYTAKKPLRSEPNNITKRVSDENEMYRTSNTLSYAREAFTYSLFHSVPDETDEFKYTSYVINDKDIDSRLRIKGVTAYDADTGANVSSRFTTSTSGGSVKIEATSSALSANSFYDSAYRFDIEVEPKDGNLGGNYLYNSASIAIKAKVGGAFTSTSNTVTTSIPSSTSDSIDKRNASASGSETTSDMFVKEGATHTYVINTRMGNEYKPSKFIISDEIHPFLQVSRVQILRGGSDITSQGSFSGGQTSNSMQWSSNNPTSLMGQTVSAKITVVLKKSQNLGSLGTNGAGMPLIPNNAKLATMGGTQTSNTVNILPQIIENSIKKYNGANANTTSTMSVGQGQLHQYSLSTMITNKIAVNKIEISDNIEKPLVLQGVRVLFEGRDVTNNGSLSINSGANSFTWTTTNTSPYLGENLDVVIDTRLKATADLTDYVQSNGTIIIPNRAKLRVNDGVGEKNDLTSNQVDVTTPAVNQNATKYNRVGGSMTTSNVEVLAEQRHAYTINYDIPNTKRVNAVRFEDKVPSALEVLAPSDVTVMMNGLDITSRGQLNVGADKQTVTWVANNTDDFIGQRIQMVIGTKFKRIVDLSPFVQGSGSILIPNTAYMYLNAGSSSDTVKSNTVNITNPGVNSQADKYNQKR